MAKRLFRPSGIRTLISAVAVLALLGSGLRPLPTAALAPAALGLTAPPSLGCTTPSDPAAAPLNRIAPYTRLVDPKLLGQLTLAYDGARLQLGPAAVAAPVSIGVTPLSASELPKLADGLQNATAGPRRGYRFTPHPFTFQRAVQVTLPYDPAVVGEDTDNLYTFYFDDVRSCWRPLDRVQVDKVKRVVVSNSTHFTDMINATVVVPDHPDGASFDPTQIKDIQAADPGSGVNVIAPPAPANTGEARLTYPLEVPPGRAGLEPQLGVSYSSSSANGWLGLGWDLPLQSISVDTRWGVPRYDSGKETESYMMAGEQLTPVAHRAAAVARTAEKVFHTRAEGKFAKIVRHGSATGGYSWEVTDKAGMRWTYGGSADSTLTDDGGNGFLWALRDVRDRHGNVMRYHNVRVDDAGVAGGGVPGRNLYLQRITYTGNGDTEGPYSVTFIRDRELSEGRRHDVMIDGRGGFKRVTADLLRRVDVQLSGALIRRYELSYQAGAFDKTLLKSVSQFDENGQLFNTHQFEYFDDIRDSDGRYQAFSPVGWTSPDDNVRNGTVDAISDGAGEAGALNGNTSSGVGGHLYVGWGSGPTKTNSVGVKAGFSRGDDEGLLALTDVDGDDLPDKVYKGGGGISYRKNLSKPGGEPRFSATAKALQNLPAIMSGQADTLTLGVEGYLGGVAAQLDHVDTTSTTDRYFTDVNGDGITDLVNGGGVLFGRVGPDGTPVYGVSADTPVPIGSVPVDPSGLLDDFGADRERRNASFPLVDTVRRWVAPFDGTVSITGAVQLLPPEAGARFAHPDGVRVAVQHENDELWSQTIAAGDTTSHTPAGVSAIEVQRGQRLYFRVGSRDDGSSDRVSWDPVVSYAGTPDATDVNGLKPYRYQASRDFTLAGRTSEVTVPVTGTLHLAGAFTKSGATTDDVTVVITRDGTPVFEQTLAGTATGTVTVDQDMPVTQGQKLAWRLRIDSPVDLGKLSWTPTAHYTVAPSIDRLFDENGQPLVKLNPPYDADLYPGDDLTAAQAAYTVPADGTVSVQPSLSFDFGGQAYDSTVVFTVKSRSGLKAKKVIQITDGTLPDPASLQVDVPATAGEELFFDFSTRDRKLRPFLTAQSVTADGAAVPSAFHHAVAEDAFAQPYRGWAAIGYNGNDARATQPIHQTDLVVDESFRNQLPPDVDPQRDKDAFTADPRITPPKVVLFAPSPAEDRWQGGETSWVAKDSVSSSRLGGQSISLPTASDLAGVTAVPRIARSEQISLTGSVGGPIGSIGGSIATGDSTGELDYLDLNGDKFPDAVGSNGIQYTDPTGTLGGTHGSLPDGIVRRSHNVTGNASAGSAARTISTGRGHGAPPGDGTANTAVSGNDMPPLGIGGSFGTGTSDSRFDLLDINGDDLPDRVYSDGRAALNLGYRFAAAEPWPGGALNDGEMSNAGINIGFNTDFYGLAGGASFNQGDSTTNATLQDVTGDSLADRVFDGNPIRVAINTGNGFAAAQPFLGSLSGINNDANARLGGGAYFTIPICFLVGCIIINPGADVFTGASRAGRALRDLNGDGYADHLASGDDGQLTVAQNRTGRTNLLKSVERPMGSRIDLDYTRDGNTYDQPHSRYVLSKVALDDGHAGDGPDVQLSTYDYSGGVYDRLEREFLGYHTVVERHLNTAAGNAVTSAVMRDYRTDSYYTRGLLQRERMTDGAGRPFTETENTYLLRDVTTGTEPANAASTTATIFPQLVRTDRRWFEGQATAGKTTFSTMTYDEFGNVSRQVDLNEAGTADDVETRIDYTRCLDTGITGTPTSIEVRGNGTLMRKRLATIDCSTGDLTQHRAFLADGTSAVTDLTYFGNGNIKSVTSPSNERGQRYRLDYTYETTADTHVASITDSFGYRSTMTYNLKYGQVETTTDVNNQVMRQLYDSVGRVDTVTGPYEIGEGRVSIDFEYHPEATVPYAGTRHVDRQADGSVRPDTIDTVTFTDGLKRVLQTKKDATVSTGPDTAPADVMTVSGRVLFDAFGRTTQQYFQVTEPKGPANTTFNPAFDTEQPTRTTYDVMDRATRVVLPDDTASTTAYGFGPDRAGVTQFETVATDAKGHVTRTYNDVRDLTVAVKQSNPAGGQAVIWTSYGYDPLQQLVRVTDDKNNVTTSAYDDFGRRTVLDSPDSGRTTTAYDLAGNAIRKTTAKLAAAGKSVQYDYDFNRLAAVKYPLFTDNNITYTYGAPGAPGNGAGRVTAISDAAGTVSRSYGPLGEVTAETRTVPGQGSHTEVFTTKYAYDTWNRVLRLTYPDGEVLSYHYNSGGLVDSATGVKATDTYQYLKRLDYDKFDQRVLLDTGNGTRTTYSYNAADRRIANQQSKLAIGYVFQNLNYNYDDVGNITSLSNDTQPPSGPEVGTQVGGPSTQSYGYDDLDRLTTASGTYTTRGPKTDHYTLGLSYDSINNLTRKNQFQELITNGNSVTQKKTTYDYGYTYASGKPHAPSVLGPHTMQYDANGNLVSRAQQPKPRRQLIWDEDNRLACSHENVQSQTLPQDPSSCDNPGGAPDARYVYDDRGNRVIKDSSRTHIYPNQNFSTDGNKAYKHVFIGTTKLLTKFVEPEQRYENLQYYSHGDNLGSTGFVTDSSGGLSEHLNYFPGGETWVEEHPNQPVPHRYTGKELDPETEYYYYGARYYDPRTSLWQSPDPALGDYVDGSPNSGVYSPSNLALYTYANGNPVRLTDPDGRWVHIAVGAGIGALVGAGIEGYRQYRAGEFSALRLGGAALGGAVAGGVGAATLGASAGGAALGTSVLARTTVTVAGGSASGAVGGAAGGATEALVTGQPVGEKALEGAVYGAAGGALGAVAGKVVGGLSTHARVGAYEVVGGHHPVAQAAMRNAANYDAGAALALPDAALRQLGVPHLGRGSISAFQNTLYSAWRRANPGVAPTWDTVRQIETQAMSRAGMDPTLARTIVDRAIRDLEARGVAGPTRIPWRDP